MNKAKPKILITGFEPFGGATVNPSAEIATSLHAQILDGHKVVGAVLKCCFGESIRQLKRHLRLIEPSLVICLGQAGGRAEITPERIAINIDDARIPDNAGRQPVDSTIVKGGPAAYWSTLPIKAIVTALAARGTPAAVSQNAGTFVCNHVFYGLMHALHARPGVRGGFMHVPYLPEQANESEPSLSLAEMTEAIRESISISLKNRHDLRVGGGQTH